MRRFLLVRHPSGWLALEAELVDRILSRPLLCGLPGSPGYVTGIFRLGGRIVPVVDLDRRWGAPARPATVDERLVLSASGVALRAGEPQTLVESEVQPLPEDLVLLPEARPFLRGAVPFPDGAAALLDLERVLDMPAGAQGEGEALRAGWSEEDLAILQERFRTYADEEEGAAPPRSRAMALLRVGEGRYAVDVKQVREIVRLGRVVSVPGAPRGILGMTLLRGRIVPVVDARQILGHPEGGAAELAVVTPSPEAAVVVDDVEEVRSVDLGLVRARHVDLPDGPAGLLDLAHLVGAQPVDGGRA